MSTDLADALEKALSEAADLEWRLRRAADESGQEPRLVAMAKAAATMEDAILQYLQELTAGGQTKAPPMITIENIAAALGYPVRS